ncbi:hypothetical protein QUB56_01025, partial [Microcoleus sp. AR_TQ3_B6]|uniref:hypothetical protein n=1 Tax=Microcoleus sp. AR_TQ3_B6 TaxID=3055284 RepID=UPI002FD2722F
GRSRGSQKPGFFPKSGVRMLKLSQKPGFLDLGAIAWGIRNPVFDPAWTGNFMMRKSCDR